LSVVKFVVIVVAVLLMVSVDVEAAFVTDGVHVAAGSCPEADPLWSVVTHLYAVLARRCVTPETPAPVWNADERTVGNSYTAGTPNDVRTTLVPIIVAANVLVAAVVCEGMVNAPTAPKAAPPKVKLEPPSYVNVSAPATVDVAVSRALVVTPASVALNVPGTVPVAL
jgi:hypothetical protein